MHEQQSTLLRSAIYECRVTHARAGDLKHAFGYGLYYFALDLDELDELAARSRWFARNRRGLYAFFDEDHARFLNSAEGSGPGSSLRERVARFIREEIDFNPARIVLFTQVRLFGYVFNPVCFYFLYDQGDLLRYVLVEVNNTFGVQAAYLLEAFADEATGAKGAGGRNSIQARVPKILHVSPFLEAELDFVFDFDPPAERMRMRIDSVRAGDDTAAPRLRAVLTGSRHSFDDRKLLSCFARYPLLTLMIIGRIHWQAFKLWRRGAPYRGMARIHERIRNRLGRRPAWWRAGSPMPAESAVRAAIPGRQPARCSGRGL